MPVRLTSSAAHRITQLLQGRKEVGIRIRLRTRGCTGLSYVMEYAENGPQEEDEVVPVTDNIFLLIHRKALLFLVGTEMDYQETPTQSGFVFRNPNAKGYCGCGASFRV